VRRLQASVDKRTAVADANARPALKDAAAGAHAELDELDNDARATYEQLAHAADLAQQIDRHLAARAMSQATAEHERTVRARLASDQHPDEAAIITADRLDELIGKPDDQPTTSHITRALAEGATPASYDLRILLAQLEALDERMSRPRSHDNQQGVAGRD
jgi:hypothetical protein